MHKTHHSLKRPNISNFSEMSSIHSDNNDFDDNQKSEKSNSFNEEDEEELPLLEELGIDLKSVKSKLMSTILFTKPNSHFIQKPDLTGPLMLGTLLGFLLTLKSKVNFGFIYGFGFFGSLCIYFMSNMLLKNNHINLFNLISILGYCITPIVVIAFFNLFFSMKNFGGVFFALFCAFMATFLVLKFLGTSFDFANRKILFGYPIFLFYFTFVLVIIS
jgi:hypothetical protein